MTGVQTCALPIYEFRDAFGRRAVFADEPDRAADCTPHDGEQHGDFDPVGTHEKKLGRTKAALNHDQQVGTDTAKLKRARLGSHEI